MKNKSPRLHSGWNVQRSKYQCPKCGNSMQKRILATKVYRICIGCGHRDDN